MEDHFAEHMKDRRKCMNCGNYRDWQEIPICPCGWPRFKNFFLLIKKQVDLEPEIIAMVDKNFWDLI